MLQRCDCLLPFYLWKYCHNNSPELSMLFLAEFVSIHLSMPIIGYMSHREAYFFMGVLAAVISLTSSASYMSHCTFKCFFVILLTSAHIDFNGLLELSFILGTPYFHVFFFSHYFLIFHILLLEKVCILNNTVIFNLIFGTAFMTGWFTFFINMMIYFFLYFWTFCDNNFTRAQCAHSG